MSVTKYPKKIDKTDVSHQLMGLFNEKVCRPFEIAYPDLAQQSCVV